MLGQLHMFRGCWVVPHLPRIVVAIRPFLPIVHGGGGRMQWAGALSRWGSYRMRPDSFGLPLGASCGIG